jgi:hypothetical protein
MELVRQNNHWVPGSVTLMGNAFLNYPRKSFRHLTV